MSYVVALVYEEHPISGEEPVVTIETTAVPDGFIEKTQADLPGFGFDLKARVVATTSEVASAWVRSLFHLQYVS